jgi:large subunit ribosomal protein L21
VSILVSQVAFFLSLFSRPVAALRYFTSTRLLHTSTNLPDVSHSALDLIRSQPSQYVVAALAGRKYLLAPRDVVTVPHMRGVQVGDVLALSEIYELGSREYTLRGDPIPENTVSVSATVLEHTKGRMIFALKKKRRKGYQKRVEHKQPYTRIRIGPIIFPSTSDSTGSQS